MTVPVVSRRAVARGAAWAVPTAVFAGAAPAFAASTASTTATVNCIGQSAGKVYKTPVTVCNTTSTPMTITPTTYLINGSTPLTNLQVQIAVAAPATPANPSASVTIPANTCTTVNFYGLSGSNAANTSVSITYSWTTTGGTGSVTTSATTATVIVCQ